RREPRPPRSVEDQQRRQRGYLVLVTLALGLALWAILAFRPPATPGLQPGSPSPVDIRARRSVTFVSTSLTEQERLRAERSPEATVYTSDPNIPIQQRAQLVDMFQAMTQIRDNTGLTQAQKRDKITSVPLPNSTLVISPALATQIMRLSADSWGVVRQ